MADELSEMMEPDRLLLREEYLDQQMGRMSPEFKRGSESKEGPNASLRERRHSLVKNINTGSNSKETETPPRKPFASMIQAALSAETGGRGSSNAKRQASNGTMNSDDPQRVITFNRAGSPFRA